MSVIVGIQAVAKQTFLLQFRLPLPRLGDSLRTQHVHLVGFSHQPFPHRSGKHCGESSTTNGVKVLPNPAMVNVHAFAVLPTPRRAYVSWIQSGNHYCAGTVGGPGEQVGGDSNDVRSSRGFSFMNVTHQLERPADLFPPFTSGEDNRSCSLQRWPTPSFEEW